MRKILLLLLIISNPLIAQDTLYDCLGSDVTAVSNWLGDGWCDDGAYSYNGVPVYFDCEAFNYDEGDCEAPIDTVPGCTDLLALNFVPEANFNDGSCEYPIFGCIDPEAPNYNPWAEADDGSCVGVSCSDGEAKIILELTLDQFPGETGWIITDLSNGQPVDNVVAGEYNYEQANQTIIYDICIPETGVEIILSDTYGDGVAGSLYNGGEDGNIVILGDAEPCGSLDTLWALDSANFGNAAYSGPIWLEQCDVPAVEGCTNNTYVEFNPQANLDDGSCETLHILGCTNPNAFNFNPQATLNEIVPTCNYTLIIEDDGGDGWGDCYIGVVQEDSILGTYTMGPGYYSQEFNLTLETDKPVKVYYFQIANPQTPAAEVAFQTMHNSFRLINSAGDVSLQGGMYPFADNGAGALKAYKPPFWHVYTGLPFCGDYCVPTVYGCLDEQALNYDSLANTDDASCIEIIEGCTSPFAFNYNSLANVDNETCVAVVVGCMSQQAWNYNPDANTADESCLYFGCTDQLALNYDSTANVNNDNCIYPIPGCIDPEAFNFEVEANVNDGSCIPVIIGCMDPTMYNYNEEANTASDNCIPFIFGCSDSTAFNYDPVANTDNGSCIPITPGCTDPNAFNYSPDANTEDFSCIDVVYGCTDETAFNYDLLSNTDNGGCIDVLEGCMDPLGYNYDAVYNTDDGSCLYDAGCISGPGVPYWLNDTCYAWVILIDPYCCNNSWDDKCQQIYWSCSWDTPLDTRDLLRGHNVVMYPNPMGDMLNILTNGSVAIDVYDISGKLVIQVKENQTTKGLNQLDVGLLPAGIYNFKVTYEGNISTTKVLKK